jgi:hypothetical protein
MEVILNHGPPRNDSLAALTPTRGARHAKS